MQQHTMWLPSTCYLVCGSKIMAARHNCNAADLVHHAVSTAIVSYTRRPSLAFWITTLGAVFYRRSSCGPYY
jgi:hypothetical protein